MGHFDQVFQRDQVFTEQSFSSGIRFLGGTKFFWRDQVFPQGPTGTKFSGTWYMSFGTIGLSGSIFPLTRSRLSLGTTPHPISEEILRLIRGIKQDETGKNLTEKFQH